MNTSNLLVQRSRRWGLCGTTLSGAALLALLGAGPIQALKTEPAFMAQPVTVHLLPAPPPAKAALPEVSAQAAPAPVVPEPENTPSTPPETVAPETMPPETMSQPISPKTMTPLKDKARKPKPRPQTAARTPRTAPVAAPVLPAPASRASAAVGKSSSDVSDSSATLTAAKQAEASLLARVMAQFEQYKRYPPAARKLGLEGVVRMQVRVNPQGRLTDIRLLDSKAHAMLGKSGMESMRKVQENWEAQPQAQDTVLDIAVRYTLTP